MITALILAAETRCYLKEGEDYPIGSCTILREVINNFLDSKIEEIIVVLGGEDAKIIDDIKKKGENRVKIRINQEPRRGLGSSILAGLEEIGPEREAVMIALGDEPFVKAENVDKIIETFYEKKKGIIVPVYKGIRGHPILFDIRKYLLDLKGIKKEGGAKDILERNPNDIAEVELKSPGILEGLEPGKDFLLQMKRFRLLERA